VKLYDFDVGYAIVLIMIIIGSSNHQHKLINVNIHSSYIMAICSIIITVILWPIISTKTCTS